MTEGASDATGTAVLRCKCVVLLSGGMDSAACVDFYQRQGLAVSGLHVSYGQPAASHEVASAKAIARHYGIPLSIISMNGARPKSDGELLGRNAFLLFAALLELDTSRAMLAVGIHSGTPYYDCSSNFLTTVQSIVDGQCDGRIRVVAPFLKWTKREIWDYCLKYQVPTGLTYSCEKGLDRPCGVCLSCRDLEALRACEKLDNLA
jgi:7-cyano-7-deazaguanine synthase